MKSISVQIKLVREFRNLSQAFVAKKLKMSQGNYARLENGMISISDERLDKICEILEISASRLSHFEENLAYSINEGKFKLNPQSLVIFFNGMTQLIEDEITLLERKLKLLKTLKS